MASCQNKKTIIFKNLAYKRARLAKYIQRQRTKDRWKNLRNFADVRVVFEDNFHCKLENNNNNNKKKKTIKS